MLIAPWFSTRVKPCCSAVASSLPVRGCEMRSRTLRSAHFKSPSRTEQ
jgi:hypothetical protein